METTLKDICREEGIFWTDDINTLRDWINVKYTEGENKYEKRN